MNRVPASHRVPTASRAKDAVSGTASPESAESGNRVPATASPRPTASRPRPDRVPAFRDEVRGTASRAIYKRDAGRGSSARPLTSWLTDLKLRGLGITTGPDGARITGDRTDLITAADWHQLTRHHHTLHLAAQGTHPTWWQWASGLDRTTTPGLADLPWTCGTCGTDAAYLDDDLIGWCDDHLPATYWQDAA